MIGKIKLTALVVMSSAIIGCVSEPTMVVDKSETGETEIGSLIGKYFYQDSDGLKQKIKYFLSEKKIDESLNKIGDLKMSRFKCPDEMKGRCSYHAEIKSKLVMENGKVMPMNNIVTVFDINIDYTTIPVGVSASVETKRYQQP